MDTKQINEMLQQAQKDLESHQEVIHLLEELKERLQGDNPQPAPNGTTTNRLPPPGRARRGPGSRPRGDKSLRTLIMDYLRKHGKSKPKAIREAVLPLYPTTSKNPASIFEQTLIKARKSEIIERDEGGYYSLVKDQ